MFYRDTPGPDALAALSGVRHACLWLDRSDRPATAAPVTGDESADLLVVGGGFTGLWTALLAKRADPSRDVVLVEGGEHESTLRDPNFAEEVTAFLEEHPAKPTTPAK